MKGFQVYKIVHVSSGSNWTAQGEVHPRKEIAEMEIAELKKHFPDTVYTIVKIY